MKTRYKVLISFLLGICFITVGIALGGGNQINLGSFIHGLDIRMNAHRIEDQSINVQYLKELQLDLTHAHVSIHEENRHDISIVATNLYEGFQLDHDKDEIKIKQSHHLLKKYNVGKSYIDIYVPRGYTFDEVDIESNAGNNTISNLTTRELKVKSVMGNLEFERLECKRELKADSVMGKTDFHLRGHENDYAYQVNVAFGKVDIGNEQYSGISDYQSSHYGQAIIDIDCTFSKVNVEMEEEHHD